MAVEPPIGRLRAQDHQAFGALVDRHYGRVYRYLTRLVGDSEAAADLAQETFLAAYQALTRLADDSNVGGWLFRIATNLARQHHRRRRVICWSRLSRLEADHAPSPSLEDRVAQQDLVRRALDQLPLDQRVCLLLYASTGYTCAEIGEIVGKSADAVRMLLVRARRRFRAAYGAQGDGPEWIDRERHGDGSPGDDLATGGAQPYASSGRGGQGGVGQMAGAAGVAGADDLRHQPERCEHVQEVLPFYPRGDLPRGTFSAVTRHLAACLWCRYALMDVQATYRLLQRHLDLAHTGDDRGAHAAIMARLGAPAAAAAVSLQVPEPVRPSAAPDTAPVPVPVRRRRPQPPPWPPPTF